MRLHPTLQSCVLPGLPCWLCASCHILLASPSCFPAEVCPFRWLSQDGHVPELSCAAPGSHVAAPVSLLHAQGCVWAHRAWRDCGDGRVGVLWGCPAPLPTARCCWQAQAQPCWLSAAPLSLPIRAALISAPCQAHPSAQPGKSSLGGAPTGTMATTASHSHSPRGVCGWTVTSHRVCTCLCACAGTEVRLCVFLEFSRCRERGLDSCGSEYGSVCPAVLPPFHGRAFGFGPSQH